MVQARQVIEAPGWTVSAEPTFIVIPAGGSSTYTARVTRAINGAPGTVVVLQVFGGGRRRAPEEVAAVTAFVARAIWATGNNNLVYGDGLKFRDRLLSRTVGRAEEFSFTERILQQRQGSTPDTVSLAYYGLFGDFVTNAPVLIEGIPVSSNTVRRTVTLRRDNNTGNPSLVVGVLYRQEADRVIVYDVKAIVLVQRRVRDIVRTP